MKLILTDRVKTLIELDAATSYPYECCGFIFGIETNGYREIIKAYSGTNINEENKRRRFEVSPKDYLNAEQFALNNNLTLLGVYHSHPDHPAYPSEHDLKYALPYFSYVIVSVKNGTVNELTSWQLNEQNQFEQETIEHEISIIHQY